MTTTPETIRITDDSTRGEIAEALTHLNRRAKREFPRIGTAEHPTPWDRRHTALDNLLDDWRSAKV